MGYYWCSSDWELTIPTGNSYEKLTAALGHSCEIAGPQKRIQSKQQRLHIQNHGTSKLLEKSFLGKSNGIGQIGSKLCYMP